MSPYIYKLHARLNRLKDKADLIGKVHSGNEQNFTYHGGFTLGYLRGQITEIENILDDLEQIHVNENY